MRRKAQLDPYRAKIHHSYSIAEAAKLFGVHRNTVRSWTRLGLPTIRAGRELIVLGADLRGFLMTRRKARRTKTPPGAMYCMGCRAPRRPAGEMVELLQGGGGPSNLRAVCGECGALMHRRVNADRLVEAGFGTCFTRADSHLGDSPKPSVNCDGLKDA